MSIKIPVDYGGWFQLVIAGLIYGKPGSKLAEYCSTHALKDYVNVKDKRCIFENCDVRPTYGKPGSKLAEFCSTHALKDYVDVKSKRCKHENCDKQPVYGKPGSKLAEYCSTHALKDYVNVRHKRCIFENCDKIPNYGKPGSKLAEYCSTHALKDYVDIRHKRCKQKDCSKHASYGLLGYPREYCNTHRLPNMILNPTKIKDVDYKTCEYCMQKIHYEEKYCSGCKLYNNLGMTVKRKNKELAIKSLLESNEIKFTHDLTIRDGCSRKRPDFIINTTWGIIILEIDEFQHNRKTYTCECEITRMKQLYFDCGVENLLFIRYNPDPYKPLSGSQEAIREREVYLVKYLNEKLADRDNFKGLGVIYLFYDGFQRTTVEIEKIDPYEV